MIFLLQFRPDKSGCGYVSIAYGTEVATDGQCTDIALGWPLEAAKYDQGYSDVGSSRQLVLKPAVILFYSVVVDVLCILLPYGAFAYYEKNKYGGGPSKFKFD